MPSGNRTKTARCTHRSKRKRIAGKKRIGFLDLPGEIRNEIYAYCFEDEIWVDMTPDANHILKQSKVQPGTWASAALFTTFRPAPDPPNDTNNVSATTNMANAAGATWAQHQQQQQFNIPWFTAAGLTKLRSLAPPRPKPHKINYRPSPHSRYSTAPGINWRTSAGTLIRTCRQIHAEALPFFYATPFFIFSAPNALLRFLRLVPAPKLALIRKLHVAHATYGDPYAPADEVWKARSDRAWARAMREASEKLVGLEVLRVRVVVNERPLVFGLDRPWVGALMVWSAACQRDQPDVDPRTGKIKRGALAPLRMEVGVQSARVSKMAVCPDATLRNALIELHRLFAEAVRRRICGWSEEDAMVEFNLVKFDKYQNLTVNYPLP